MAYEFKLPDIGEGMAEGEIVRWLVKEGDTLAQDQPMVEVMTDKATVEIATPRSVDSSSRIMPASSGCASTVLPKLIASGAAPAARQSSISSIPAASTPTMCTTAWAGRSRPT